MSDEDDAGAPGWAAIDAAFAALYPGVEPKHWGPALPPMLSNQSWLNGISIWKQPDPRPHWHFVTYGLSELFAKESDIADQSGWGFELTFRLACDPNDENPPGWALDFLHNLARYVVQSGNPFASGHWLNANGPIALKTDTLIHAVAFANDPQLPPIDTPHGRLAFLQVIGLTTDEGEAIRRWNTIGMLDLILPQLPLWITDLDRRSLLDEPEIARAAAEGSARTGSSTGMIFTSSASWDLHDSGLDLVIGANQIQDIVVLLPRRLPFGQDFTILGTEGNRVVTFMSGPVDGFALEASDRLAVTLTPATVDAIAATLQPIAGLYATPGFPRFRWRVEKTLIRDRDGNVVSTVG